VLDQGVGADPARNGGRAVALPGPGALFIVDDEAAERELICQALRGEPGLIERSYREHTAAMKWLGMRPSETTWRLHEHPRASPVTAEQRQRVMTASGRR
jgi:hypothetical protein